MAQWIKGLTTEPDHVNLTPIHTWWKERASSHSVPSDLHGRDAASPHAHAPSTHNKCDWKSILKRNRILLRNSRKNFFPRQRDSILRKRASCFPARTQTHWSQRTRGTKWHREEAGTAGCSRRPRPAPRTEGPSRGGWAFHTSEPLMCCDCVASYLSPLNFFIWRSGPALTWDFVLQTECSYVCEAHSRPHECCHSGASHSTQPGPQGFYFLARAS